MDTPSDTWTLDSEHALNGDADECPPVHYDLPVDDIPNETIQDILRTEGASHARVVAAWCAADGTAESTTCLYAYRVSGIEPEAEVIGDSFDWVVDQTPHFPAMRSELVEGRNPWIAYAAGAGRFTVTSSIGVEELDYIVRASGVEIDSAAVAGIDDGDRVELGALVWDILYRSETVDPREELALAIASALGSTAEEVAWQWELAEYPVTGDPGLRVAAG